MEAEKCAANTTQERNPSLQETPLAMKNVETTWQATTPMRKPRVKTAQIEIKSDLENRTLDLL
jgi:uncharacterized protein YhdP